MKDEEYVTENVNAEPFQIVLMSRLIKKYVNFNCTYGQANTVDVKRRRTSIIVIWVIIHIYFEIYLAFIRLTA